jgi:hypothetical protein
MRRRNGRRVLAINLLIAEAIICLLFARLALACLSFRQITRFVSRPPHKPELLGLRRQFARRMVKRAIFNAWKRFPMKTTCFHRAITAYFMLHRRGVSTTLYYGATFLPDRGLTGHVWLQDGLEFVVGQQAASGYHALAYYPDGDWISH